MLKPLTVRTKLFLKVSEIWQYKWEIQQVESQIKRENKTGGPMSAHVQREEEPGWGSVAEHLHCKQTWDRGEGGQEKEESKKGKEFTQAAV